MLEFGLFTRWIDLKQALIEMVRNWVVWIFNESNDLRSSLFQLGSKTLNGLQKDVQVWVIYVAKPISNEFLTSEHKPFGSLNICIYLVIPNWYFYAFMIIGMKFLLRLIGAFG